MSDEEIAAEMTPAPDDPTALTQEEEEERAALLREGFSTWNRRDFQVQPGQGAHSTREHRHTHAEP